MFNPVGSGAPGASALASTAASSTASSFPAPIPPPIARAETDPGAALQTSSDTALERLQQLSLDEADEVGTMMFLTPQGEHAVLDAAYLAIPKMDTATALRLRIRKAADSLLGLQAPGVLLLGGPHNQVSALTLHHAAVDLCRKYGFVLCMELMPETVRDLQPLAEYLLADPRLRERLGGRSLASREGQKIAFDYVRRSGDRGALQRFLPEVLALQEVVGRDLPVRFIDPLGRARASDEDRESIMCHNIGSLAQAGQRAVVLTGIAHLTPIQVGLERSHVPTRSVAVFDDMANTPGQLYDFEDGLLDESRNAAHVLTHNLRLPGAEAAAARTDICRVGTDFHPFS